MEKTKNAPQVLYTLGEALKRRIPRIRKPNWMDPSYLRLPLLDAGASGPWAELYDEPVQLILGIRPGSQRVLMLDVDEGGFEVYTGPISKFEEHEDNFARRYAEN